jgi:hypothetical protein
MGVSNLWSIRHLSDKSCERQWSIYKKNMDAKYQNRAYSVNQILVYLSEGNTQWAIPRLQRPFVWNGGKVCDLISSMFLGYPVGSIMTWKAQGGVRARAVGSSKNVSHNDLTDLVLDGQQRLTSLKVLFEGITVETNTGVKTIKIQFNPLVHISGSPDKAFKEYKNKTSPKWLDVATVLSSKDPISSYNAYVAANQKLTEAEKTAAAAAINELLRLREYQVACVEVSEDVDVDNAAEIFYRINSKGTVLKGSDFILTLLEVGDQALRDKITDFSRDASKLSVLKDVYSPENGDTLAALVGYSFRQSAGKKVYDLLRGREGRNFIPGLKEKNFETLKSNVDIVCDLKMWREFLAAIMGAGICHRNLITSDAALISSYVIYLMMCNKDKPVSKEQRQKAIGRWLLFCTLTSRYTSHTDTQTVEDCKTFDAAASSSEVLDLINGTIDKVLTDAFWQAPFAGNRETIMTIALIQQGQKTLFSKVHNISDQYLQSGGSMEVQIHHIFPQNYLLTHPDPKKRRDQEASDVGPNKASIDASANRMISDKSPVEYVPLLKSDRKYSDEEWDAMCSANALPKDWHMMEFDDFVEARAKLIPLVIKKTFDQLR